MPVMEKPPIVEEIPAPPKPVVQRYEPLAYRSTVVDTRLVPIPALLTNISGSRWPVRYYGQLHTSDEELTSFSPTQHAVYQQYLVLNGLELRVQEGLAVSQDEESAAFDVIGTSIVYPYIIPNQGDAFFADIGDGRSGHFNIYKVERKSIFNQSCYQIWYGLVEYETPEYRTAFDDKVVQTYYHHEDFLLYGQNPVLLDTDHFTYLSVAKTRTQLLNLYMRQFYNGDTKSISLPGQTLQTYDPFLTRLIISLFSKSAHPMLEQIHLYNVGDFHLIDQYNLWDVLLKPDNYIPETMPQKAYVIPSSVFTHYTLHNGIYYSDYKRVVMPDVNDNSVAGDYSSTGYNPTCECTAPDSLFDLMDHPTNLSQVLYFTALSGLVDPLMDDVPPDPEAPVDVPETADFHPVTIDNYYVLSRFFYSRAEHGQSRLELLVNAYLQDGGVDEATVLRLCVAIRSAGRLEQFYYTPLLFILLNYIERKLGS